MIARNDGVSAWWLFLLALLGGSAIHLGLNVANDVSDATSGADFANVNPTMFSGGSRMIQYGLLSVERMRMVAFACYGIGIAIGLYLTVTRGIVSGVGRAIKAPNGFSIDNVIQTDAPINPGNSGGPLLDGAGRVIGVNSQIATTAGAGGNVGIGFAVPSNTVRQVVPRLRAGGTISRPYLGISSIGSTVGQGALVASTASGGPAEQAGVRPGDLVTRVDGRPVQAPEDISSAIEDRRPGDEIDLEVQRAGSDRTLRVTLGTRPANASSLQRGP
ncbi:MAG: PDZ domain-containing protein [Actinobacteria bacterium]|nr:PDZ domain-containing protein [Actinomycetota bacterium]